MNNEQQWINASEFWSYSCSVYQYPHVKDACLYWQDHYQLNVNVLLLFAYGQTRSIKLPTITQLEQTITPWHHGYLLTARNIRRQCESIHPEIYAKAKKLELVCEKVEQAQLISAANSTSLKNQTCGQLKHLWQHYGIPNSEKRQLFLTSIKSYNPIPIKT